METILLDQQLKASVDEVWEVIDAFCARSPLGIADVRHTEIWHGDYHGAEIELQFIWDREKLVWLGVTGIGRSKWSRQEHLAGFCEVSRVMASSDTPVRVRIASDWELLKPFFEGMVTALVGPPSGDRLEIYVDDIDSFEDVKSVTSKDVRDLVPLELLEDEIKAHLEEIIGEKFTRPHWPGETSDLFTSHIRVGGDRLRAAFILKGRGTKRRLRIKDCGANGDQILRLSRAPAQLLAIQHVGEISEEVIADLSDKVRLRIAEGAMCQMCIIDGVDTARILRAYARI